MYLFQVNTYRVQDQFYQSLQSAQIQDGEDSSSGSLHLPAMQCEAFHSWTLAVDVCALKQYRADFGKDFSVVKSFEKYRGDLETKLKDFHFSGHLAQIGSCWDGSKVGRVNEMDCLYVIDNTLVDLKMTDKPGEYKLFLNGEELNPRHTNVQFADYLEPIVNEMQLPPNIWHSGYAAPSFSGVRFNGPAVTSLFEYRPDQGNAFQISLDLTLAFPVDQDNAAVRDLCRLVQEKIAHIATENVRKQTATTQVHVVPNLMKDIWQLSTAYLEANILRDLPVNGSVNITLHNCKGLIHQLEKLKPEQRLLYLQTSTPAEHVENRIIQDIMAYHSMEEEAEEMRLMLNQRMRYEHIYLHPGERQRLGETSKSAISINSAVVKHIILGKAFTIPGSFSEVNAVTSDEMMRDVFRELSDTSKVFVPHSFLGTPISKFSLLPSMASVKYELVGTVRQECQQLLQNAMTEVGMCDVSVDVHHCCLLRWNYTVAYISQYKSHTIFAGR